jgi:HK97 family phage major capsid protein
VTAPAVTLSDTYDILFRNRREAVDKARAIIAKADSEHRQPNESEDREFNEYMAEADRLDKRMEDERNGIMKAQAAEQQVAAIMESRTGKVNPLVVQTFEQQTVELRNFMLGKSESRSFELALPNAVERRVLVDSSAPLPTGFVGQLYKYLVDTSSVRQANPYVISTTSGESIMLPRSTAEGAAQWTGENAALSASDPTFSSITLGAFKLAKILQVSSELIQDTGFDVVGFMAEHAGRNLGIASDTAYVAGTGTNQPSGFIGSATVALTAATGTGSTTGLPTAGSAIGADVLIELYHSILPQYRPRASFIANDSTIKAIRKLKDTTGQYIWQPALVAGQPDTVLSRPIYADPNMPAISASSKCIAFGAFDGYAIRDVTPIRFERSDDYAFGTDLVSFRAIFRTDGKQLDANAIKLYQAAAS